MLVLVGFSCGDSTPEPVTGTGLAALDGLVQEFLRQQEIPGAALAVVHQGRLVVAGGYGWANRGRSEPVRPDHLFRWASVSKPITAVAVLAAAEDGFLDLDEPAWNRLGPFLALGAPADRRVQDQTVAHLLHHTGGWNLYGHPTDPLFRMREIADTLQVPLPPQAQDVVRWSAGQVLAFDPGTDWWYTNLAYIVLGRVLESASGMSYQDYVRHRVFAPAGAARPQIGGIRREDRLEGEVEYASTPQSIWVSVLADDAGHLAEPAYGGVNLGGMDASSGWVASVVDLARLAVAIDGDPVVPDILSEASRAALRTSHGLAGRTAYGAGFFVATASEAQGAGFDAVGFIDHAGGMPGTNAYLHVRDDGIALALVANGAADGTAFDTLLRSLLREISRFESWPVHDLFATYP
jgi:N-acyl-D-amino-acid deacylase